MKKIIVLVAMILMVLTSCESRSAKQSRINTQVSEGKDIILIERYKLLDIYLVEVQGHTYLLNGGGAIPYHVESCKCK